VRLGRSRGMARLSRRLRWAVVIARLDPVESHEHAGTRCALVVFPRALPPVRGPTHPQGHSGALKLTLRLHGAPPPILSPTRAASTDRIRCVPCRQKGFINPIPLLARRVRTGKQERGRLLEFGAEPGA